MKEQVSSIDLTSEQLHLVRELLREHIPHAEVWAYGSRVKWTATPTSDLDLVAHVDKKAKGQICALREAFDESSLPFRVDLFIWDKVPVEFHTQIKNKYFVVQDAKTTLKMMKEIQIMNTDFKIMSLTQVCDSVSDTYKENSNSVILINTSDVFNGSVLNHQKVPNINLKGQFKKTFKKFDILFSEIRPINKRFAYIKFEPNDYIASTKLMVIRAKEFISSEYLYWVLTSERNLQKLQLLAEIRSGTFPQITFSELDDIQIFLPPLHIQKKIAHVLSTIDKKIELNQRINENLEQQAQAIFKSWFVDFEPFGGVMPSDWGGAPLEEITALVIKGITPKYVTNADQFVINQKCIRNHQINIKLARGHAPKKINEKWLQYGDILINSTGQGTLGRTAQVWSSPTNLVVDSHVTIVRAALPIYIHYLGQLLISSEHIFEQMATGSTGQTDLPRERLKAMHILRPTQDALIDFNAVVERLTKKINDLQLESESLIQLRDTLLPKLMSGEIDVSQVKL